MKNALSMKHIQNFIRQNKEPIQFIILFLTYCMVFYLFYHFFKPYFSFLENITASILGFFLDILGINVTVIGNKVVLDNLTLKIIDECTAVFGSIIYISCILAFPAEVKNKITGIAFGIPCIYTINIIRLIVLAIVGLLCPGMFDYMHTYLWQTIFIIFVILIWLIWVDKVVK